MVASFTLGLALLPLLIRAYETDPPTTASPDTISNCTWWQVATETDTCAGISEYWGITEVQFKTYNPSLVDGCNLVSGNSYCIEQNYGIVPTPSATSSSVTSASQTPTPTPTTSLEICEAEAGGYKRYCPRCLSRCENETKYMDQCFYSTFLAINSWDSQCWQHGGSDCANRAVDEYCPNQ
ncbi:hypothetical protein AA0113_g3305 [Alternaria arborescens]|uniref:LysM domain-containing protein n=1 Tax=Alternaria arborescens TaxID=156630 RepID=A0A4Q4SHQ0_9PLEO|nr:hypothetical protein AA0111_g6804 [Alternaria arborescens]RYO27909.1 hypothetical protein AA0111_g6804 [Alternaria arborescens]RYO69991.1 hypothetical protein AA0113_g3305 [Alternaria arborescens]